MANYGMLIDVKKCIGCYACRVSCQNLWDLPENESLIRSVDIEKGKYPIVSKVKIMMQCNHCENAPCLAICPTKATYKDKDGRILVDPKKCIGCKSCMAACPYGARVWSEKLGVPEKCKFCGNCAQICPTEARIFGDLEDPTSALNKAIIKQNAKPYLTEYGTKPKLYFAH